MTKFACNFVNDLKFKKKKQLYCVIFLVTKSLKTGTLFLLPENLAHFWNYGHK